MDWDGVIADSLGHFMGLYQRVCDRFGRGTPPCDAPSFRRWYNPRWERNYLAMGYTEEELPEVLGYAVSLVDYSEVPLFAGAVRAIREVSRDVPLAICSTTDSRLIRDRLAKEGLDAHFQVMIGGEDGGSDKISRYRLAAESVGAEPRRCVAVGDTVLDVESARHWGMRTIGVTYGWSHPELVEAAAPDVLVRDQTALTDAIRQALRHGSA